MSGSTNSAPQKGDVTRGRPVITRSMRFAILAFIGVLVLLLLAYMFLVGSKQVPRDDGYKAQAGRSFIAPHLPLSCGQSLLLTPLHRLAGCLLLVQLQAHL